MVEVTLSQPCLQCMPARHYGPREGKVITATMAKLIQNGSQIQRMVDERVEALARQMYGSNTRKMDVRVYGDIDIELAL